MSEGGEAGLDWLVAGASAAHSRTLRAEWVRQVLHWIRRGSAGSARAGTVRPEARLRFLLGVFDRHPEQKLAAARVLRAVLAEQDGVGLLCDVGLPRAHAFVHELVRRISDKFLPAPPAADDLASLFTVAFPAEHDAAWVAALPQSTVDEVSALIHHGLDAGDPPPFERIRRDAEDALVVLASQAQAIGMSSRVRQRFATERALDSPFAGLVGSIREWIDAPAEAAERAGARAAAASSIARCRSALASVMGHLENYGVNTDLVYQLERARLALARMARLIDLSATEAGRPLAVAAFIARLARANASQSSVRVLFAQNGYLLARRAVESAHRTGEHYLTRDAAEYRAMLRSAAIGGAVMGIAVIVKLAAVGKGLPPFLDGLVASLNYATCFVAIHLLHGTVATKQPAMTAAAMAFHLDSAHQRGRLRGFLDDAASLIRSQIAAIAGNLVLVAPAAIAIQLVILGLGGGHLPDRAHAQHYVDALSIAGPTPLFAAYTGVLLWLSAVIGGWFENWAIYRGLPGAIAHQPMLARHFGAQRAQAITGVVTRNVSALGANVSLGFLLGMTPEIARFFGIPLEVRHVTLSTGQLALASFTLGWHAVGTGAFWLAVAGVAVNGVLNLVVSFGLALAMAVRAAGLGVPSRRRLRRALAARVVAAPRDFLLPPRSVS
jgi:site-specific recombinase